MLAELHISEIIRDNLSLSALYQNVDNVKFYLVISQPVSDLMGSNLTFDIRYSPLSME